MFVGLAFAGLALYSALNTVLALFMFVASMGNGGQDNAYIVAGTAVLALVGLGVGGGLLFMRRPWQKGLGLGLMAGWVLWSVLSRGFFTGLHPDLYI